MPQSRREYDASGIEENQLGASETLAKERRETNPGVGQLGANEALVKVAADSLEYRNARCSVTWFNHLQFTGGTSFQKSLQDMQRIAGVSASTSWDAEVGVHKLNPVNP